MILTREAENAGTEGPDKCADAATFIDTETLGAFTAAARDVRGTMGDRWIIPALVSMQTVAEKMRDQRIINPETYCVIIGMLNQSLSDALTQQ